MYLNTIIIDNEDIQITEKERTKITVNFFNNLSEVIEERTAINYFIMKDHQVFLISVKNIA